MFFYSDWRFVHCNLSALVRVSLFFCRTSLLYLCGSYNYKKGIEKVAFVLSVT